MLSLLVRMLPWRGAGGLLSQYPLWCGGIIIIISPRRWKNQPNTTQTTFYYMYLHDILSIHKLWSYVRGSTFIRLIVGSLCESKIGNKECVSGRFRGISPVFGGKRGGRTRIKNSPHDEKNNPSAGNLKFILSSTHCFTAPPVHQSLPTPSVYRQPQRGDITNRRGTRRTRWVDHIILMPSCFRLCLLGGAYDPV